MPAFSKAVVTAVSKKLLLMSVVSFQRAHFEWNISASWP